MKILTSQQMRAVDELTSERYGIPSLQLMENAATAVTNVIESRFGPLSGRTALVFCGRGNNGGDGAAIARLLFSRGATVTTVLLGSLADTQGDARTNFERAASLAAANRGKFEFVEANDRGEITGAISGRAFDLVIDAIFGTGLSRPATGLFESAIDIINDCGNSVPVVAVDVPSGIASDSSELIGPAVRSHLTVTFTAPKIANLLPYASDYSGELIITGIGSPAELIEAAGSHLSLIEVEMIRDWLVKSRRSSHANKGDVGKVLIIAGSRGKTGAACLAGEAAMRAGAGLVTVATPESQLPIVASRIIAECMTEPLAETDGGTVAAEAAQRVLELIAGRDVVAIGPGLGSESQSTRALVRQVVSTRQRPVVLDADALNSLAPWPEALDGSPDQPLILTPHPGEMARLTARTTADVIRHRLELVAEFASLHHVIIVLKGDRTLIASPDGEVFVNPTGNAGMATGGTGDVLTGIIASFVAQHPADPLAATIAAVYLHGLAGDFAAQRVGTRPMIASDLCARLTDAFREIGGDQEFLSRRGRS